MVDRSTAGTLLRGARLRAGLSQAELARRAQVTQSVISVYESGRRQPSLPTLSALVAATGVSIDIRLGASRDELSTSRDEIASPRRRLGRRLRTHAHEVKAAASAQGVSVLGVFGSVARGDEHPGSDIDLLLDVPVGVGLFALGRLEEQLRTMLGAEVDLVPQAGLKPRVREQVLAELLPL